MNSSWTGTDTKTKRTTALIKYINIEKEEILKSTDLLSKFASVMPTDKQRKDEIINICNEITLRLNRKGYIGMYTIEEVKKLLVKAQNLHDTYKPKRSTTTDLEQRLSAVRAEYAQPSAIPLTKPVQKAAGIQQSAISKPPAQSVKEQDLTFLKNLEDTQDELLRGLDED